MRHSSRSFIGHNSTNSWSQFWEGGTNNQILCLINIASFSDDSPSTLGHIILDKISNFDLSQPTSLNIALQSIKDIPTQGKVEISLSLAVFTDLDLYLGQLNSGSIYFQRQNKLSLLIDGVVDSVKVVSGKISDLDRIFFTSENFSVQFPATYLQKNLVSSNISTIEEAILSDLVNLEDQDLASAALIEFHQDQSEPKEEPAPEILAPEVPEFSHQQIQVAHIPTNQTNVRRKVQLFVGIIVLILFLVSLFFSYRQNQAKALEQKYQNLATQIQQSIDQSIKLKTLSLDNSLGEAKKASGLIAEAKLLKTHADKIAEFESTINGLLTQTGSEEYQPETFFDTSLIAGGLNYTQMRVLSGKIYLLDPQASKLFDLSIEKKAHTLVSDDSSLLGVIDFAIDTNQVVILKNNSISVLKNGKLSGSLDLKDISPSHFHLWNGSAYYLTADNIYKSAPNNTAFSPPQVWLKTGNLLPPNSSSIAINGSIWTITSTGQITSYTQGAKDKNIPSLSADIKSASRLQAAADYDKLVFTDGDNLVYVYNKAGESVSKFNFGSLKISDIALDPPSNTAFVLCTDQKIYKISL